MESGPVTGSTAVSWATRALLVALAMFVAVASLPFATSAPPVRAADEPSADESAVIVILEEGVDPVAAAEELGVEPTHIYEDVFTGFAAPMSESSLAEARASGVVEEIAPDGTVRAEDQVIPSGVLRSGLVPQPGTQNLAMPSPIDADIAILDTGIARHGDLNVVGGTSCIDPEQFAQPAPEKKDEKNKKRKKKRDDTGTGDKKARKGHGDKKNRKGTGDKKNRQGTGDKKHQQNPEPKAKKDQRDTNDKRNKKDNRDNKDKRKQNEKTPSPIPSATTEAERSWEDDNGHGTHIAGIAAAFDNTQGVVGVAPGARLWAVKVLDANGAGSFSDVICGLDWVLAHSSTIDVVNLSLSGAGSDGPCASSPLHNAVCNVVFAGIPVVVAAGNQGTDASTRVPASYEEVITVSAFGDSDGAPGKQGPVTCSGHADDTFLGFANFGADVDVVAPGDCILSLVSGGEPRRASGTSEASPHVAGAVAQFIAGYATANGVRPSPDQVKSWLMTEASEVQDGIPIPVLWLR